jgi:sugar/nucleoside kinase (ribokinase family)
MNVARRILIAAASAVLSIPVARGQENLAIRDVTIIDATGAAPKTHQTILIEHGRIAKIGANRDVRVPSGTRTIDGAARYLIPGLWDMHVHLAGVAANPSWSKDTILPLLLANGITGVRDMGGDLSPLLSWKRAIADGKMIGPHLIVSGPMLENATEADPSVIPVSTAEEGRLAVRKLQEDGADFIKVLSLLTRESYFAISDESRSRGLLFVGHVPASVSTQEASDAGQASIEHILYGGFAVACAKNAEDLQAAWKSAFLGGRFSKIAEVIESANQQFDMARAQDLWKKLVSNHTWVVPTLISTQVNGNLDNLSKQEDLLVYLPPGVRKTWAPSQISRALQPARLGWYQGELESEMKLVSSMHRAGVRIMVGTDSLDTYNIPGLSLHQELALLVECGLTPMEALQAGTVNAAVFLGKQAEYGTIQEGKVADIIILDADPLENIANTQKIDAVIVAGRILKQVDLAAMLKRARESAAQVTDN